MIKFAKLLVIMIYGLLVYPIVGSSQGASEADFNTKKGVAINGYDPVAYFTLGQAVEGDSEMFYDYMGARWLFATTGHLALFIAQPEQYLPQYGGYCAYGMAGGRRYCISGRQWEIYDGKLYLFYPSSFFRRKWQCRRAKLLPAANAYWSYDSQP